jgi:uncharacterized membrane protein
MCLLKMVSMTQGKWSRFSPNQRADVWIRWKAGQTLHEIGPHPTFWINFMHPFVVTLVPFATAWAARTKFAAVPVLAYAVVIVLVNFSVHSL